MSRRTMVTSGRAEAVIHAGGGPMLLANAGSDTMTVSGNSRP